MLLDAPRAVVLVCGALTRHDPAVRSVCLGHRVVARFVCTEAAPSEPVLAELADVAVILGVDRILVLNADGQMIPTAFSDCGLPPPRKSRDA